jgi:hypothetical protein
MDPLWDLFNQKTKILITACLWVII